MKQLPLATAIGFAIWFGCTQTVDAAVMAGRAYEPFDYASSPSPNNQIIAANNLNGRWGWNAGGDSSANAASSNWGNAAALPVAGGLAAGRTVTASSLMYSATGYPASAGNKATIEASTDNNVISRNIGQLVDSGTFYFSYLTDRNIDTLRTASLGFFGPANGLAGTPGNTPERFTVGQIGVATVGAGSTNGNIGLLANNLNSATNTSGVVNAANPIPYGTNVAHMIAGRVDFNPAGNETIRLYVDPTDMTAEPATPYIQTSAYELTSFNSIRLFAGSAATINGVANPAASIDVDEIRIGSTWSDLTSTVPRPPKYKNTLIDYPDYVGVDVVSTSADGISPAGDIVGEFTDSFDNTHAFIRTAAGVYSTFSHPDDLVGYTTANGMNSSGQIVGSYSPDGSTLRAYRRTGNSYVDLTPFSGAPEAAAYSINDVGHAVGYFAQPSDGAYRGFFDDGTTPTTLNKDGAAGSQAIGINNSDQIVGYYFDGTPHGFLYAGGVYTTIDYPLPGLHGTIAQGINDAGDIVGLYLDASDKEHGFIKTSAGYTTIDHPDAARSVLVGINNAGQVAGSFLDASGVGHGFLATPVIESDFNDNGSVGGFDLAAWQAGFGATITASKDQGDSDADGDVDGFDFLKWQTQFTLGSAASPAATGVPEPAALALSLVCIGWLASSTRRRRWS